MSLIGCTINLKIKHWGSLNSTPLQYSMVLSWIPDSDSGKSGMGMGMIPDPPANRGWDPHPRSPANRGWGRGWGSARGVPCGRALHYTLARSGQVRPLRVLLPSNGVVLHENFINSNAAGAGTAEGPTRAEVTLAFLFLNYILLSSTISSKFASKCNVCNVCKMCNTIISQ